MHGHEYSVVENHQISLVHRNYQSTGGNGAITRSNAPFNTADSVSVNNNPLFICRLECITQQRFTLHMPWNDDRLNNVCASFQSGAYDASKPDWSFNLGEYQHVLYAITRHCPYVVLVEIPAKVISVFASMRNDDLSPFSYLLNISQTIVDVLLPSQRQDVAFGITQQGRILIADDMGFGKAYQALALADYYRDDWPLLIVTTEYNKDSWIALIQKLLPSIICLHIGPLLDPNFKDNTIFISTYQMLERCGSINMGVLILDESHMLKSLQVNSIAVKLADKAKRVILLSEMPALSRPVELYPRLRMLDTNFLNYKEYTTRYCAGEESFGWDASGQTNLDELKLLLFNKYMIRRTEAEFLLQPDFNHREAVYLDPAWIKTTGKLTRLRKYVVWNMGRISKQDLLEYYDETAMAKRDAICAYVKNIVQQDIKFIIYAYHEDVLKVIGETLQFLLVPHIRIDMDSSVRVLQQKVHRFQTQSSCRVAVLSLKNNYNDIQLSAAGLVIFAELDLNPSILIQAESQAQRINRIGEASKVPCRYLIAHETADDIIWRILHCNHDGHNSQHRVDPNTATGESTENQTNTHRNDDIWPGQSQACVRNIKTEPIKAESTDNEDYSSSDEFEDTASPRQSQASVRNIKTEHIKAESIDNEDHSSSDELKEDIKVESANNDEAKPPAQMPTVEIKAESLDKEVYLASDDDEYIKVASFGPDEQTDNKTKIDTSGELLNDGNDDYFEN